jgi:hypothetical protein
MSPPDIDRPEVVAEVTACFEAYDEALLANDVEALVGWFWPSASAVRYGIGENLYGAAAIAAHRRAHAGGVVRAPFSRRVVATFGDAAASVCADFDEGGRSGRQSQTWIRFPEGWRIVAAHVSLGA